MREKTDEEEEGSTGKGKTGPFSVVWGKGSVIPRGGGEGRLLRVLQEKGEGIGLLG